MLLFPSTAAMLAVLSIPFIFPADNVITAILHLHWHKQPHHDASLKTLYVVRSSMPRI